MADVRDQLQAALGSAFAIERELLGGGMSRVFVATETSLGRRVAIKVLSPELANSISAERFRREIQIVAQLQHPHIVPVHAAGDANGLLYYTMPFVEGETLRTRLLRDGKLPVAETLALLIELADALAYAHGRGVIHRDIKPENVLLSGSHATLADFGVSRALSAATGDARLTTAGLILGTPAYMAPEQIMGDTAADARADLYSLGLVAYEMLAGGAPFEATTPQQLIAAHVTEAPRPVAERRPETPPALAAIVMRCLEKDPAKRPHSAAELAAELRAVSSGAHEARVAPTVPLRGTRAPFGGRAVLAGFALAIVAGAAWMWWRAGAGAARITSIAVIPIVNAVGDSTDDYFADGITDELTSALGKTGIKVASRSSAFRFKGRKNIVEMQIGESLHVAAVVGGTVRRDGNMIRLTAHLTRTADGSELWSDKFDRTASGIFAMQDDLTRDIVAKLNLTLKGGGAPSHGTQNTAAYDLYLRGRFFWNQRTRASLEAAAKAFGDAVAADSTYALAWAGLADSWALTGTFGYGAPGDEFPRARTAAERAVRLDSTLAEAHTSLGVISLFYDWDWAAAARELDRAEALNPGYATTFLFKGWRQVLTGHADSAVATVRHALELDPVNMTINVRAGSMLLFAGRFADAERQLRSTLALDSSFYITRSDLSWLYTTTGRFGDAAPFVPDVSRDESRAGGATASFYYGRLGKKDELRRVLRELAGLSRRRYVPLDGFVVANAWLGDLDAAFAGLDRAVKEKDWTAIMVGIYPEFAPLRGDPRFAAIRRATHLEGVPLGPALR